MLLKILLHRLLRLGNVDGENNQSFIGELFVDLLDQGFFLVTVLAPAGPEFEQDYFAFDRFIVEAFSGGGFGAKTWSGLAILIIRSEGARGQKHREANNERSVSHGPE
jgi:hypothetical protein